MARIKMDAADRKASILAAAGKLAKKHGSSNLTRRMIAEAAKCSEALVTVYLGDNATARKAIAAYCKRNKIEEPSKEKQEAIGLKLRAHGPRDARRERVRTPREVKAIREKRPVRESKPAPAAKRETKPSPEANRKPTAARQPKAPPVQIPIAPPGA